MNDPGVLQRRSRIFLGLLVVLGAAFAVFAVVGWVKQLSWAGPFGGVLFALFAANGLWMWLGTRWVRAVQPVADVPADMGEAYMAAKRRFVARRGTWGFGLVWGVSMATWNVWKLVPDHRAAGLFTTSFALQFVIALAIWVPFGLLAGYAWGRMMWAFFAPRVSVDRTAWPARKDDQ